MEQLYRYLGDRHTAPEYKSQLYLAIRRPCGKCIRGKNGSMLVKFTCGPAVVIGRQLRKINLSPTQNQFMKYRLIIGTGQAGPFITIQKATTILAVATVRITEQDHQYLQDMPPTHKIKPETEYHLSASSYKGKTNLIIHHSGSVQAIVGITAEDYTALTRSGIQKAD